MNRVSLGTGTLGLAIDGSLEFAINESAMSNDDASTLTENDREDDTPSANRVVTTSTTQDHPGSIEIVEDASPATSELTPLSKSNRLKQYLKLVVISSLAFASAYESDGEHIFLSKPESFAAPFRLNEVIEVVPASTRGRNYSLVLSGVSAIYHFIIVAIHLLDAVVAMPRVRKMFQNGSELECVIIVLSAVWWVIGTWVTTSIHGTAGDGRGQFNLYFSTWLCCIANLNMIEIWLISAGYASVYQAVSSWPNRAPGWIMIFSVTLACLLSILDLFLRFEDVEVLTERLRTKFEDIQDAQWICLILACAISLLTAFGFSLIELFRREDYHVRNIKSSFEFSLEGICLACLVFMWVPIVVIATTSDGACSEVGNSYFLIWATALVVIQTFIHFLQSWRRGVHDVILKQDREYKDAQSKVVRIRSSQYDDDSDDDENSAQNSVIDQN